jgi:hypothetical protein
MMPQSRVAQKSESGSEQCPAAYVATAPPQRADVRPEKTMSKVGLHVAPIVSEIFPRSPRNLRDAWSVVTPQLHDEIECVQIGGRYVLSLGAHDTHANLLLSASHAGSIQDIRQVENLISYVFDVPCLLTFPNSSRFASSYYKGLKQFFALVGHRTHPQAYTVEHRLAEIWETVGNVASDGYIRLLPRRVIRDTRKMCWTCEWPSDDRFSRATAVYRQALVSPEPHGMILNYWRALEAVSTQAQRYSIAENLGTYRLKAVRAVDPLTPGARDQAFNLMSKYRRHVLGYLGGLVAAHGSPKDVIDHLYKNRRNPSAHADHSILDVSGNVTLRSLYEDALLMKYMCRCAIESHWNKL